MSTETSESAESARFYTGEFPPDGSAVTVDEVVAGLLASVTRVRMLYGVAVDRLAARTGQDAEDAMADITDEAQARAAMLGHADLWPAVVASAQGREETGA